MSKSCKKVTFYNWSFSNSDKNSEGVMLNPFAIFTKTQNFISCFKFSMRLNIAGSMSFSIANLFNVAPVNNLLFFIKFPSLSYCIFSIIVYNKNYFIEISQYKGTNFIMFKKTILFDLDGVLNNYDGKYDKTYIPPIRDGAYELIKELSENYKIVIFTTRNLLLVSKWLIKYRLDSFVDNITNTKEPAYLIIDDRCINFKGDYDILKNKINNFNVWYK